jgi:hypothetical protein
MVQQTIEHGADRGDIAEQLAPVLDRTVGSEQGAKTFVAPHDAEKQSVFAFADESAGGEIEDQATETTSRSAIARNSSSSAVSQSNQGHYRLFRAMDGNIVIPTKTSPGYLWHYHRNVTICPFCSM